MPRRGSPAQRRGRGCPVTHLHLSASLPGGWVCHPVKRMGVVGAKSGRCPTPPYLASCEGLMSRGRRIPSRRLGFPLHIPTPAFATCCCNDWRSGKYGDWLAHGHFQRDLRASHCSACGLVAAAGHVLWELTSQTEGNQTLDKHPQLSALSSD